MGTTAGPVVYAGSTTGSIRAIDAESGRLKWSRSLHVGAPSIVGAPATRAGMVVAIAMVSSGHSFGEVIGLSADDGDVRWRWSPSEVNRLGSAIVGEPLIVEDRVVVTSGDGALFALDLDTGVQVWRQSPISNVASSEDRERDIRPLAASGRTLFAGSLTGVVVAYDHQTGLERWKRFAEPFSTGFQIAAGARAVYVPYQSGVLVALDVRTGVELWRVGDMRVGFAWPPAFSATRMFVASPSAGFQAWQL
jgi:outer membrane protein assembly factor BamB